MEIHTCTEVQLSLYSHLILYKKFISYNQVIGFMILKSIWIWFENIDKTNEHHIWNWRVAQGLHRSYNDY
jgi:hypothetical protein